MFSFIKVKRNIQIFHSFIHVSSQYYLTFFTISIAEATSYKMAIQPTPTCSFFQKNFSSVFATQFVAAGFMLLTFCGKLLSV